MAQAIPSLTALQPQYSALMGPGQQSLNVAPPPANAAANNLGLTTTRPSPTLPVISGSNGFGPAPAMPNLFGSAASPTTPQVGAGVLSTPNQQSLSVVSRPATPSFKTNYGNLINNNGTIKDTSTGKVYSTPAQLAADLGVAASQIQWGQIRKAGPAPAAANIQTTPSGQVVNGNTGAVVTPAAGGADLGLGGGTAQIDGSSATGVQAPPDPYNNPLYTSPAYEKALTDYKATIGLSPEQILTQQQINDLNSNLAMSKVTIGNQAIPIEGITGQQKAAEDRVLALEAPLTAKAALLQAQRTAQQQGAQFSVEQEGSKLSAYRDINKPVALGYGGSLVNPATGQVKTPAFGGSGSGSATDVIGQALSEGRLTPDMVTRYGIPFIAQALQNDPGYNFVTQKSSITSNTSSLTQQTQYLDTTSRAYNTAKDNLGVLQKFMTDNTLNQSNIPLINQLQNKIKAGALDPGAVAAFQTQLSGLRAEYAQVLARGGDVTDTSRKTANDLIPDDLSPAQLQKVATQLNLEGDNAIKEATQKVKDIQDRLKSGGTNFGSQANASTPNGWF